MPVFTSLTLTIILCNLMIAFLSVLKEKNLTSLSFFFIAIFTSLWLLFNHFVDLAMQESLALFWTRLTNVAATWLVFALFLFSGSLNQKKDKDHRSSASKFIFSLPLLFSVLLFTDYIIKGVRLSDNVYSPMLGTLSIPFFIFYLIGLSLTSALKLIKGFIESGDEIKQQYKFILFGLFLSIFFSIILSILVPIVTRDASTAKIAPLTTIFFISFTAYAITKHGLFNIKVIVAEMAAAALVIVNFAQVLSSNNWQTFVFRLFLFVIVSIFGYLLVKSVRNEVNRREELYNSEAN